MKKNIIKIILPVVFVSLFAGGKVVLASEITGTLSTSSFTANTTTVENTKVQARTSGGHPSGAVSSSNSLSVYVQNVDSNKDGKIDVVDFVSLMVNWNKPKSSSDKYDVKDFVALMVNWTK